MITRDLVEAFAFSTPVICAVCCMLMMLMDVRTCQQNVQEKRLRLYLALIYLVTALGWLGMVLYAVSPDAYYYYHTVFLLALMFDQVMFYHFVSLLTNTGGSRRLNRLHVAIPLAVAVFSAVCDPFVVHIFTSIVFIVYNTLYPLLNLHNIRRYRHFVVDYSSEAQRTSLDWLFGIQLLIFVCIPVPLAGILLGIDLFSSSWFVWLGALPYFVFYIILCYNMLDGNYLIVQPEVADEEDMPENKAAINRVEFERYMREKKPYLHPRLRITDLAAGLNTNRSYLSAFINSEYNMNFSRLINRYRLAELYRLRQSPRYCDKCNMELVLKAGFGNYRNYLRVKTEEDKLAVLKLF